MFDAVNRIRAIVDETHPRGHLPYSVGDIHRAVKEVTGIEKVVFNGFHDPDCSNPIWGRFRRFENAELGPYLGRGCAVEIDYNKALEAPGKLHFLRFVIVKELCHSLEEDPTVRVSSFPEMERLVKALQSSHANQAGAVFAPFLSEVTAEICALELLCPLRDRQRLIQRRTGGEDISDMASAKAFWIPVGHVSLLFDPEFVEFMEKDFG